MFPIYLYTHCSVNHGNPQSKSLYRASVSMVLRVRIVSYIFIDPWLLLKSHWILDSLPQQVPCIAKEERLRRVEEIHQGGGVHPRKKGIVSGIRCLLAASHDGISVANECTNVE